MHCAGSPNERRSSTLSAPAPPPPRTTDDAGGGGRKRLSRGVLAYRAAYPDLKFEVEALGVAEEGGGSSGGGGDESAPPRVFVSWCVCAASGDGATKGEGGSPLPF